eukprot:TRINITY_DN22480_c0_g1_i2.p1 TRINITY_DN22480_c0_g1~~TRINITY_DN22480_c0_g1_i2.p1  ORF type:complete len:107 (-),score=10.97 TRINITY_DN22480_c0_g1_i2:524-844(-)
MHLDPAAPPPSRLSSPFFFPSYPLFHSSFSLADKTQSERSERNCSYLALDSYTIKDCIGVGKSHVDWCAPLCGHVAHLLFQIKADKNVAPLFHELGQISLFKNGPT